MRTYPPEYGAAVHSAAAASAVPPAPAVTHAADDANTDRELFAAMVDDVAADLCLDAWAFVFSAVCGLHELTTCIGCAH